jgi:CRP-like cAMP-binding protein
LYRQGEHLIREGEPSRELFVIAGGRATVRVRAGAEQREIRLTTFSPGVAIGELALFDEQARSASVIADEALVCWVLPQQAFERLKADDPRLALALASSLAREMAHRLRRANRTICELDA